MSEPSTLGDDHFSADRSELIPQGAAFKFNVYASVSGRVFAAASIAILQVGLFIDLIEQLNIVQAAV